MLNVYEFGKQLLDTNDLDPVYVVLHNVDWDVDIKHWLLSYWCFYHAGTASWIVDSKNYWRAMETAAGSKEYPRSPERRHFRAQNAIKSVAYLKSRGVASLFEDIQQEPNVSVEKLMKSVQKWVGFGPWIAFKVADMVERLGLVEVQFDNAAMFLFDSPREGAELMYEVEKPTSVIEDKQSWAVNSIIEHYDTELAPPQYDRPINTQEAETILCKWKSYRKGHYKIGEDVESLHKALTRFDTRTCKNLLNGGRKGGLWS